MTRHSGGWYLGAVMVVALVSGGFAACAPTSDQADNLPVATGEPPVDPSLSGASIFDLDVSLIDQDGQTTTLAELDGDVMLAAMVYTSCTSVCLRVTEEMKIIESQLSGGDRGVRFVLFSLDPGRDSPAAMRTFAASHGLDTRRWRLLAAAEDGVRDLAAVLGVRYQEEVGGEIAHSAMIFVIDPRGVVRHRQVGIGQDATALVAAVRRARG